jgi:hypothetical protein
LGEVVQLVNSQLVAGPPTVGDGSSFPAGQSVIPLDLVQVQKSYAVTTGRQLQNISSPSAYVVLPQLGSTGAVTQAHTLYMRSVAPFLVQLTQFGLTALQTLKLNGLLILEVDPAAYVTAIQVQGSGQLEWLAVGNL